MTVSEKAKSPFYVFVESDIGLSLIPIHQALIVILSGYGKFVSKKKIRWED